MDVLINTIIRFLIAVESAGNPIAVGDNGASVGCLQIQKIAVRDVNRILKRQVFTYEDRLDPKKSIEMCKIYLQYYGQRYKLNTGKEPDFEVLSRIWVGGPDGWKQKSTLRYWKKVDELMKHRRTVCPLPD